MTVIDNHGSCSAWAPESDLYNWRDDAACRGLSPSEAFRIFFPDHVGGRQSMYDEARTYCDRCPVSLDCYDDALLFNDRDGFRAGHAAGVRTRLRHSVIRFGPCHECGETFQLRTRNSRYCSQRCSNRVHARRVRASRAGVHA